MLAAFTIMAACGKRDRQAGDFTAAELAMIHESDSIMRVLTIDAPSDLAVLRSLSYDLSDSALLSDDFKRLAELMVATVTHPSQDGVGIHRSASTGASLLYSALIKKENRLRSILMCVLYGHRTRWLPALKAAFLSQIVEVKCSAHRRLSLNMRI